MFDHDVYMLTRDHRAGITNSRLVGLIFLDWDQAYAAAIQFMSAYGGTWQETEYFHSDDPSTRRYRRWFDPDATHHTLVLEPVKVHSAVTARSLLLS